MNSNPQGSPTGTSQVVDHFRSLWASGSPPDVFDFLESLPQNPTASGVADERFQVILADQYERWQRGLELDAEEYFQRCGFLTPEARLELVTEELGYREERDDFQPAEFVERFRSLLPNDQLAALQQELSVDSATHPLPTPDSAPPSLPYQPGDRLGRYALRRQLGRGSFGVVFLAEDTDLLREVAIKLPNAESVSRAGGVDAFLNEARLVAALDHPGIVPLYDVNKTEDGQCYLVSKFIDGGDLTAALKHPMRPVEAAKLIARVASAAHHAHRNQVIHRDIKPANILLDKSGQPYLVDFGLAIRDEELGSGSDFVGTPAWMSPEQARGEGHRVDARSDVYSLGVVLFEALTGQRPHRASSSDELLERIREGDVRPPRQFDDSIPKAIDRICIKALARRASERYSTALDLADELESFVAENSADSTQHASPASDSTALEGSTTSSAGDSNDGSKSRSWSDLGVSVVPKGLRSFDADDAEFFMQLLPGPRDRFGVPDSLRFWVSLVQATSDAISVGLLYGPSGCGKSSFVKAGLLPRVEANTVCVYVEASPQQTEADLLRGLQGHWPELAHGSLRQAITQLRRASGDARQKTLIVIDQFEQRLHAWDDMGNSELTAALRQCDGERVQAILLVRDDFWMAATRFFREIEVPLIEGRNSSAIDLFDQRHARRVLESYGRAYGAIAPGATLSDEQNQFIRRSIEELASGGTVIPVRLALFAEMVKQQEWTPRTLRDLGGAEGVGVAFLEDAFGPSAPPKSRLHSRPAREVLRALLPDHGADIRGGVRTRDELAEVAGYPVGSADFRELLGVLDNELRVITPSERQDQEVDNNNPSPLYQLTHDYMVVAVRAWLARRLQTSMRGRAVLRLERFTDLWTARPEPRMLPSAPEYFGLLALTSRTRWSDRQRRMMAAASRRVWSRVSLFVALLVGLVWGVYELNGRLNARSFRDQLLVASIGDVPALTEDFAAYSRWTEPLLQELRQHESALPAQRLNAILALSEAQPSQSDFLADQILTAEPDDIPQILGVVRPRHTITEIQDQSIAIVGALKARLTAAERESRLNALAALALLTQDGPTWKEIAPAAASDLVDAPASLSSNLQRLAPVSQELVPTLLELASDSDIARRRIATIALAEYFEGTPTEFCDLLEDFDPEQFRIFADQLDTQNEELVTELRRRLNRVRHTPWPTSVRHDLPPDSIVSEIEEAVGVITPDFAYCQTLPLDRVSAIVKSMKELDYRLLRLRPFRYDASGPRVAILWTRDTLDWDWCIGLTEEEIMQRNAANVAAGLLPADVAGYLIEDDDIPRYAFLWKEKTQPGEQRDFYLGLPTAEHVKRQVAFENRGLREFSRHLFTDREEYWLLHSMVWGIDADQTDDADFQLFRTSKMQAMMRSIDSPIDICLVRAGSEENNNLLTHYGAIWMKSEPNYDRTLRMDLAPEDHRAECHKLIHQGYRPASLSVARTDPGVLRAASIWIRPTTTPEQQFRDVLRQTNCAAALIHLGQTDSVLTKLEGTGAPALRSELIQMWRSHGCDPGLLLELLEQEEHSAPVKQALVLALGQVGPEGIPEEFRHRATELLAALHADDRSSGVHSAAAWALEQLTGTAASAPPTPPSAERNWYVTGQNHVMAIVDPRRDDEPFLMGSPYSERGASWDERRHNKWIHRKFAIATCETTVDQFERFAVDHPEAAFARRPEQNRELAQTRVDWLLAARYCNWLSEQEGLPPDQWCFEISHDEVDGPQFSLAKDYLSRKGYRLPSEAEWEYTCRSGTLTARNFGQTTDRLGSYAWVAQNSENRVHPVGQLMPNGFGLFDTFGNVREWCMERWSGSLTRILSINNNDHEDAPDVILNRTRVTKGGSFQESGLRARSGNRIGIFPYQRLERVGFRIARTLEEDPKPDAAP